MVDIDNGTPYRVATAGKNEPDDKFEFFIAKFKSDCEKLVEDGDALLKFKPAYDAQRPVLENDQQVERASELIKAIGVLVTGKDAAFLAAFKRNSKGLEETVTRMKAIRDAFMAPLVKFDGELRERVNVFQRKQRAAALKKEDEDRAAAAKLAASGKPEDIQKAAAVLGAPPPRAGTVKSDHGTTAGYAVKWKIGSIDSAKLPVEFMSPDKAKIELRLKGMTEAEKKMPNFIPGVVFIEDIQTRIS